MYKMKIVFALLGIFLQYQFATTSPVVGGETVTETVPYQVSIQTAGGTHVCGGSILNNEWILSAAHCAEYMVEYLRIITGTLEYKKPGETFSVSEIRKHCQHNNPSYTHDIALFKLSRPMVFNEKQQPVTLATSDCLSTGDSLVLTGWGSKKAWGKFSTTLQKVTLNYLENSSCRSKVKHSEWFGEDQICTYTTEGKGLCSGDSGGSLVDSNQVQYGIVNYGEPCAIGYPDVYASVPYFYDWIYGAMNGTIETC